MSDQTGPGPAPQPEPQPPYAPPAQPPYAPPPQPQSPAYGAPAYAQQPQPQPPAYGAPAYAQQPQPPAKKSRAWVVVLIGALVFVCCGGTAAVGLIGLAFNAGPDQAATLKAADASYAQAIRHLRSVSASAAVPGSAAESSTVRALDAAKQDLAAARATIGKLPDTDARKAYLQALDGADAAAATIAEMVVLSKAKLAADAGAALYDRAWAAMEKAIDLAAARNYVAAVRTDGQSKALYQQARAKIVEARRFHAAPELDKSVALIDLQLRKSDIAAQADAAGVKGQMTAYSRLAAAYNKVNREVRAIKNGTSLWNPIWANKPRAELQAKLVTQLDGSEALAAKAREMYAAKK